MNLEELFEVTLNQKLAADPSSLNEFSSVIQIVIGNRCWHLNPNSENAVYINSGEHPEAECSISMSESDFLKLMRKELNIPLAIAFRKIKVQGNPLFLTKLKDLFE